MTFNIERLRKAVQWVEIEAARDDAGNWWQEVWARGAKGRKRKPRMVDGVRLYNDLVEVKCASGMCVAGWVCAEEGDKFLAYGFENVDGTVNADYVVPKGSKEAFSIDLRARELLGISERDAEALFEGSNELADVKRIAKRIAKKYGETL